MLRKNYSGFVKNAEMTINAIYARINSIENDKGLNAFNLKCLIGEIALLPAYMFQAKGNILSKSEAICRASELYTNDSIKALDWATRVRSNSSSLVHNQRMDLLGLIANWSCLQRHQAEKLYKNWSPWVSLSNCSILSFEELEAIKYFAKESKVLLKSV